MAVSYSDLPANQQPQTVATQTTSSSGGEQQQYSDDNPPNFNEDKAGWVRYYYGEEYLEDGKYPRGIVIDHGGQGGVHITGYRTTPETHPWLYPGPGDVHTNGKVYPADASMYNGQGGYTKGFKASPADIKASHDKRNYYKNGGQGLPPEMVRTFVDDRSPNSPYWQRHAANAGKAPEDRPYPSPEEVTGPYGRYQYQRQNYVKDPHTRATDYQVGYRAGGLTPSRFISNGTAWDPENPLPRSSNPDAPPGQQPPPSHREPPADQAPPPPQETAPPPPPPTEEPPSNTGPVETQPGPTVSIGGSTSQAAPPPAGQANADPMTMVQGQGSGGMPGQAAPPPAPPQPPQQQGMLGQARAQTPPPSGMFGT